MAGVLSCARGCRPLYLLSAEGDNNRIPYKEDAHVGCKRQETRINSGETKQLCGAAVRFLLLHHRCLLLANAGQALLDQSREFFLAGQLDLRVFLGHANGAVAGDL